MKIAWKMFDAKLDMAKTMATRMEAERNANIDEIAACPHRTLAGFYDVKCKHPERRPGEQCVSFDCPFLFE